MLCCGEAGKCEFAAALGSWISPWLQGAVAGFPLISLFSCVRPGPTPLSIHFTLEAQVRGGVGVTATPPPLLLPYNFHMHSARKHQQAPPGLFIAQESRVFAAV
jgi:hypothetical protein